MVDGQPAALGARAFDLLLALVDRAGAVVTKQQLLDIAWAGAVVEENNLPAQVWALRKVLGPDIIVTVPGRGYRFAASVEHVASAQIPPAPPVISKLRTNLPNVQRSLLGREGDLILLSALADQHRIVSIVGPGGMGKSLLAQCLLARYRDAYAHGVCWVELAAVIDAESLPGAIAACLGLQLDRGGSVAGLMQAVAPLQLLIALDNAEHLLADVSKIAQMLHDAAPGLRIILTSQAPLRLPDEQVFRLGPLSVPEYPVLAHDAVSFGSIALFVERAKASDAYFVLADEHVSDVIALCRALDGLPLAIELAAARVSLLSLPRLVASLSERLNLFSYNANRWAPARQQTLRSAMEWSHGFLNLSEKLVFRRLGVVAGSASLEMVQLLACGSCVSDGVDSLDTWEMMSALQVLVDRSLVIVVPPAAERQEMRYRLLETQRAYARERLAELDEVQAINRRHAMASSEYCVKSWMSLWAGQIGFDDWMTLQESELANAKQAFSWACANAEVQVACDIGPLLMYGLPRSRFAERMGVADNCMTLIDASLASVTSRLQTLLAMSEQWIDTRLPLGEAATRNALQIARSLRTNDQDSFWLYFALAQLASILARQHSLDAAATALREMRTCENSAWPAQRRSIGAVAEYTVARMVDDPIAALICARQVVVMRRSSGANGSISVINLIDAEIAAGHAQAAVQIGDELLLQLDGSRDEYSLALLRLNLTSAWLALNQPAHARHFAEIGWKQAARFNHSSYWADYLALLAAQERRPRAAARMIGLADRGYLTNDVTRGGNEERAREKASAWARLNLGDPLFEVLRNEGDMLREDSLGSIGLCSYDP